MPIYVYRCPHCGFVFEEIHPVSKRDEPVGEHCYSCGEKYCVERGTTSGSFKINGYSEENGYSNSR